jgi:hypothetical protein
VLYNAFSCSNHIQSPRIGDIYNRTKQQLNKRGLETSVSADTHLLYDVLNIDFGIIKFPLELSKRGVAKPDFRANTQVQSEVKILGKTFKNVVVDTYSQKTKTTEP